MKSVNPMTGSTAARRRRNKQPNMNATSETSTMLRYQSVGTNVTLLSASGAVAKRFYCPGFPSDIVNVVGPNIASFYATGVFKPGTHLRWEPTTSPTSGGRGFVGFTTNPEVMVGLYNAYETYITTPSGANYSTYSNLVKGLGDVVSFPMWQEFEFVVPTKLRRKRFDINANLPVNQPNENDRSAQIAMFACFDGINGISDGAAIGSFWYKDVLDVEGISSVAV